MGRDDATDGVAARQHNSAMIHNCHRMERILGGALCQSWALSQGATAGRAPVGLGFGAENGVALRADAFHTASLEDRAHLCTGEAVWRHFGVPRDLA